MLRRTRIFMLIILIFLVLFSDVEGARRKRRKSKSSRKSNIKSPNDVTKDSLAKRRVTMIDMRETLAQSLENPGQTKVFILSNGSPKLIKGKSAIRRMSKKHKSLSETRIRRLISTLEKQIKALDNILRVSPGNEIQTSTESITHLSSPVPGGTAVDVSTDVKVPDIITSLPVERRESTTISTTKGQSPPNNIEADISSDVPRVQTDISTGANSRHNVFAKRFMENGRLRAPHRPNIIRTAAPTFRFGATSRHQPDNQNFPRQIANTGQNFRGHSSPTSGFQRQSFGRMVTPSISQQSNRFSPQTAFNRNNQHRRVFLMTNNQNSEIILGRQNMASPVAVTSDSRMGTSMISEQEDAGHNQFLNPQQSQDIMNGDQNSKRILNPTPFHHLLISSRQNPARQILSGSSRDNGMPTGRAVSHSENIIKRPSQLIEVSDGGHSTLMTENERENIQFSNADVNVPVTHNMPGVVSTNPVKNIPTKSTVTKTIYDKIDSSPDIVIRQSLEQAGKILLNTNNLPADQGLLVNNKRVSPGSQNISPEQSSVGSRQVLTAATNLEESITNEAMGNNDVGAQNMQILISSSLEQAPVTTINKPNTLPSNQQQNSINQNKDVQLAGKKDMNALQKELSEMLNEHKEKEILKTGSPTSHHRELNTITQVLTATAANPLINKNLAGNDKKLVTSPATEQTALKNSGLNELSALLQIQKSPQPSATSHKTKQPSVQDLIHALQAHTVTPLPSQSNKPTTLSPINEIIVMLKKHEEKSATTPYLITTTQSPLKAAIALMKAHEAKTLAQSSGHTSESLVNQVMSLLQAHETQNTAATMNQHVTLSQSPKGHQVQPNVGSAFPLTAQQRPVHPLLQQQHSMVGMNPFVNPMAGMLGVMMGPMGGMGIMNSDMMQELMFGDTTDAPDPVKPPENKGAEEQEGVIKPTTASITTTTTTMTPPPTVTSRPNHVMQPLRSPPQVDQQRIHPLNLPMIPRKGEWHEINTDYLQSKPKSQADSNTKSPISSPSDLKQKQALEYNIKKEKLFQNDKQKQLTIGPNPLIKQKQVNNNVNPDVLASVKASIERALKAAGVTKDVQLVLNTDGKTESSRNPNQPLDRITQSIERVLEASGISKSVKLILTPTTKNDINSQPVTKAPKWTTAAVLKPTDSTPITQKGTKSMEQQTKPTTKGTGALLDNNGWAEIAVTKHPPQHWIQIPGKDHANSPQRKSEHTPESTYSTELPVQQKIFRPQLLSAIPLENIGHSTQTSEPLSSNGQQFGLQPQVSNPLPKHPGQIPARSIMGLSSNMHLTSNKEGTILNKLSNALKGTKHENLLHTLRNILQDTPNKPNPPKISQEQVLSQAPKTEVLQKQSHIISKPIAFMETIPSNDKVFQHMKQTLAPGGMGNHTKFFSTDRSKKLEDFKKQQPSTTPSVPREIVNNNNVKQFSAPATDKSMSSAPHPKPRLLSMVKGNVFSGAKVLKKLSKLLEQQIRKSPNQRFQSLDKLDPNADKNIDKSNHGQISVMDVGAIPSAVNAQEMPSTQAMETQKTTKSTPKVSKVVYSDTNRVTTNSTEAPKDSLISQLMHVLQQEITSLKGSVSQNQLIENTTNRPVHDSHLHSTRNVTPLSLQTATPIAKPDTVTLSSSELIPMSPLGGLQNVLDTGASTKDEINTNKLNQVNANKGDAQTLGLDVDPNIIPTDFNNIAMPMDNPVEKEIANVRVLWQAMDPPVSGNRVKGIPIAMDFNGLFDSEITETNSKSEKSKKSSEYSIIPKNNQEVQENAFDKHFPLGFKDSPHKQTTISVFPQIVESVTKPYYPRQAKIQTENRHGVSIQQHNPRMSSSPETAIINNFDKHIQQKMHNHMFQKQKNKDIFPTMNNQLAMEELNKFYSQAAHHINTETVSKFSDQTSTGNHLSTDPPTKKESMQTSDYNVISVADNSDHPALKSDRNVLQHYSSAFTPRIVMKAPAKAPLISHTKSNVINQIKDVRTTQAPSKQFRGSLAMSAPPSKPDIKLLLQNFFETFEQSAPPRKKAVKKVTTPSEHTTPKTLQTINILENTLSDFKTSQPGLVEVTKPVQNDAPIQPSITRQTQEYITVTDKPSYHSSSIGNTERSTSVQGPPHVSMNQQKMEFGPPSQTIMTHPHTKVPQPKETQLYSLKTTTAKPKSMQSLLMALVKNEVIKTIQAIIPNTSSTAKPTTTTPNPTTTLIQTIQVPTTAAPELCEKRYKCVGKDMFTSMPSISHWCIGMCLKGKCVDSVCSCNATCERPESTVKEEALSMAIASAMSGQSRDTGHIENALQSLLSSLKTSTNVSESTTTHITVGHTTSTQGPNTTITSRITTAADTSTKDNHLNGVAGLLASIEKLIDVKLMSMKPPSTKRPIVDSEGEPIENENKKETTTPVQPQTQSSAHHPANTSPQHHRSQSEWERRRQPLLHHDGRPGWQEHRGPLTNRPGPPGMTGDQRWQDPWQNRPHQHEHMNGPPGDQRWRNERWGPRRPQRQFEENRHGPDRQWGGGGGDPHEQWNGNRFRDFGPGPGPDRFWGPPDRGHGGGWGGGRTTIDPRSHWGGFRGRGRGGFRGGRHSHRGNGGGEGAEAAD